MKKNSSGQKIAIFAFIGILVFFGVFIGITMTQGGGTSDTKDGNNQNSYDQAMEMAEAEKKLENMLSDVKRQKETPQKASVTDDEMLSEKDELPEISKYPLSVTGKGGINVEIFSSPEKAGTGMDGWLNEAAESFNEQNYTIGGKTISVSIRSVSSGLAYDYIRTDKYVPDAITPSNEFWGSMLNSSGIKTQLIEKKLCGNVAGILFSKTKYKEMIDKYGAINMKVISQTTANGELLMGYTNPFVSSTGLNFLVNTLYTYDADNILSEKAADGFRNFQLNVPLVSYNTLQMRKAADSGTLDAMVMEYQQYSNDAALKNSYVFTPFGVRHDSPLYSVGVLSSEKTEVLKKFAQFCLSEEQQRAAAECGFNSNEKYVSEIPSDIKGDILIQAQKLYKENKNSGKKIMAVFVADISGSMNGEPLNSLKTSLINSMQNKYISQDNYIGLISYANRVHENLPIAKFDLNQQAYFKGAVQSLSANGQTATYDALLVAIDMIHKAMKENPDEDIKPMIFLLSDGEQNVGYSLNEIESLITAFEVPVYTIGYNANIEALKKVSEINEAATINAESDDITYQLKNLFNSEM